MKKFFTLIVLLISLVVTMPVFAKKQGELDKNTDSVILLKEIVQQSAEIRKNDMNLFEVDVEKDIELLKQEKQKFYTENAVLFEDKNSEK